MRSFTNIVVILLIGLSLGGASAAYLIERTYGIGAINVGPWSAWPFVGGAETDPYTIARLTSDGTIPLGAAEGLTFEAMTDSAGQDLRQNCRYVISGSTSNARLWTLTAYNNDGAIAFEEGPRRSAIFSGATLRFPDGSFEVTLSNLPSSGNWMPLANKGNFRLVLRLYDTPFTANAGLLELQMPEIERVECET